MKNQWILEKIEKELLNSMDKNYMEGLFYVPKEILDCMLKDSL